PDNGHGWTRCRETSLNDSGHREAIAGRHDIGSASAYCRCNIDTSNEDDAAEGNSVRTIADTGCNLDASVLCITFADSGATPRTIAGSERNPGAANDAECYTQIGSVCLASRERHCFLRRHSSAVGIAKSDHWR